ncbi:MULTISPECIES: helix-turn-helix domain-containing protein [Brevibacillus]|uniref:helix-turn-helix domain-containing protein n=1 Tax=Brevibacillus TaxID=55080 RepID=UPI002040A042|nr:helix-turn-helix transcriptional regulator [Brevibacillus borstelensis]MCM3473637.1 helix-turn-helix domain-containing protein [Brevibacillus borstelensis]MED1854464.1 helix-turn-helix transcriptional regulator [Brevibacillus borstelensis]
MFSKRSNPLNIEDIFGAVLRRYRKLRNLSQEELALQSNLDRTYISLLETGKRSPTINTLFAVCETLNIKPSDLIKEVENEYKKYNIF